MNVIKIIDERMERDGTLGHGMKWMCPGVDTSRSAMSAKQGNLAGCVFFFGQMGKNGEKWWIWRGFWRDLEFSEWIKHG